MDFNVAVALYETADSLEVLLNFPQSLLIKLYSHINKSLNMHTLKCLTKTTLIKKLEDVVRYHPSLLNLHNADT
jgi:hypothetical protein